MGKGSTQLTPVDGAEAGLFWLEGQYVFRHLSEGKEITKFVSPAAVRAAFSKEPVDSGWLPENVLRCGNGSRGAWMVKWVPPAIYSMTLAVGAAGESKTISVPMPSLIWFGQKNHYYIWAAKEKSFKPGAALYRAPLPNANHDGLICFGDNAHPDVGAGGFERTWKTFWSARFTDHHDNDKSKKWPKSIIDGLIHLDKARTYPLADLASGRSTLEQAITRLTRRGEQYD
jgi:PRTRC genetic system protein B